MADFLPQLIQKFRPTISIYTHESPGYRTSVSHRFGNGISEVTDVVEPGSESDLGVLMELISEKRFTFAIKNGGHMSIPKFDPTSRPETRVLISMKKFNHFTYNQNTTLDVGAGLTWGEVYENLSGIDPKRGVVGGDPDVGVSGWLLGGGYSLLTNMYGLGIDNIVGFQVLLPGASTTCNASHQENPNLFKALKGGRHNFGIVTQFTLKTYDLAQRRKADHKDFGESDSSRAKDFMVTFIQKAPREEVAVLTFRHDFENNKLESSIRVTYWDYSPPAPALGTGLRVDFSDMGGKDLNAFFFGGDDPAQPTSLLDVYEAFALRHLPISLETLQRTDGNSDFVSFDAVDERERNAFNPRDLVERKILTSHTADGRELDRNSLTRLKAGNKTLVMQRDPDPRGRMACIMVTKYTRELMDEAEKQAKALGKMMSRDNGGKRTSFEIWPFHNDAFNKINPKDCAWPHEEGKVFGPLVGWFEWSGSYNDNFWLRKITNALKKIQYVALQSGCTTNDLPMYLNITLETTSAEEIYRDNYDDLKTLREKYDPFNVMGLAEGFIIT